MDNALMAGWGTGSEIQFIARLGRESSACALIGRAELLRRYLAAMDLRVDWVRIDPVKVGLAARRALGEAEGMGKK